VVFEARALDMRLKAPDRAASLLARQQCEHAMLELGFDTGIVKRARALIPTAGGFRSLTEVAPLLRVSPRTLKRKLAREGATFSELLERVRTERAKVLLRSAELTLEEVADRLGYSSFPNFARAFRRWTGETPASHRRAARARIASAERVGPLH
jgi:AraC-like DNA-binding protein